ncbi:glycerophosphodiester phosphodiesterase [Ramlibacter sp. USB13]|uniref:Glycerophosphodiester phosphodiesterase n=1 Tax=Ramlibacter cellulosilyticus TaxID=2764187 RepID=A0A923SBV0_9BURK|nr:glycerophosphodiester phosphodiesterase [Ramlibacter cellulosilyticus]MBC5784286.1 glycerophosphodiester phosphodiesterase [Ramlibacter cellulosilyticus]
MRKAFVAAAAALLSFGSAAFDLQGHRGARGLAPENTLPAFEQVLAIGVSTLELDVAVTADGVVVISHDPALNPALTRDASGAWLAGTGPRIKDLTFAQLQAYDVGRLDPASQYARGFAAQQPVDGTRIPTLAALFERVRALRADTVRFNIELKLFPDAPDATVPLEQMVAAVLKVIRDAGMRERVHLQSFDWRSLQRARELDPAIPLACLSGGRTVNADSARRARSTGCSVWSPNGNPLTQALVAEAHALGLQVVPWTINEPAQMATLLDWGVDGLITDHPDRLRALLERRGIAVPAPVPTR